ncbi:MAG: aromatic ring-hydroxylating dioxygenase subunit alpha, partial [Candidatus Tectomicrobia bacterium]|nr:aromatic ring-hydroxylating dioxygenase subunit alpha [Candidatus Tectomicrobia bacterium]
MRESVLWPALAEYWHPVALSEDVDGRPLAVRLLDERVVVCRMGSGEVRAFHDLCIHRGTPISLGWVEGETVVCAYHGWAYDADGKCIRIPSLPSEHPIPKKACLTLYHAAERYGLIWVCLAEKPRAPVPDVPELEDPSYRIFFRQRKPWQCSAARAVENFVDFAHFPWIHEGILGDRDKPLAPRVVVRRDEEDLWFEAHFSTDSAHPDPYRRSYRLTRPFSILQWMKMPEDKAQVFFFACAPHSAGETTRFMIVARNFDLDAPEIVHGPITVMDGEIRSRGG